MSMKSRFGVGLNLVAEWPEASITLLSSFFLWGVLSQEKQGSRSEGHRFYQRTGGMSMNFDTRMGQCSGNYDSIAAKLTLELKGT